jgi:hypothetical protein
MVNFNQKNKWFTLVETIIVCTLFAFMVLWIILGINKAYAFINSTKLLVRATNFAREWVEMVYNIRDTNWRRYSWIKDEHRNDIWTWSAQFTWWIYVLKEKIWEDGESSFIYADHLTWNTDIYEIEWFFNDNYEEVRQRSKITFTWNYSFYSWWTMATWSLEELLKWNWTEFYRILRVYWIYCKNSSDTDDQTSCSNTSDPKEMRFCVKVFYDDIEWQHSTELCSIMTNFME